MANTRRRWREAGEGKLKVPTPTMARPGSPEKVEVLRSRLERGEALYHPGDEIVSHGHLPHTRRLPLLVG